MTVQGGPISAQSASAGGAGGAPCVGMAALALLMPMFLRLDAGGRVLGAGPTMAKIAGAGGVVGRDFFTLFQIKRPRDIATMPALLGLAGGRLHLSLRGGARTAFRGLAVPLTDGGALVNLSFGISVAEAVRGHDLTNADFAPTDLTVEMLYLAEAKSVVTGALRDLNGRLQEAKSAAEAQALTDTLTGLANRRRFEQVMEALLHAGQPFGLLHVDLDFFKQVNDTLGHAAGDHVLREVARRLRSQTRPDDTIARVGGDEFVLLFPGLALADRLRVRARKLIARLREPIDYDGTPCRIAASIGLTVSTFYARPDADQMLADADRALYASKKQGRSRVTVWSPGLDEACEG